MIIESDLMVDVYRDIASGVVQEYLIKPAQLDQLRKIMGIPQPQGPSQAEMAAILKRVNFQPPLTGGSKLSSSPSLK